METENSKKYRAVDPVSRFRWALSFPGVSPAAGKVLAALAYHADQQKLTCWPAIATLARETQVSERGVQCAIRQLEAAGAILTERSRGRTSNIYRLMIPPNPAEPAPLNPAEPASTPQNLRGSTPQNLHPNPAESAPLNPAESAPQQSYLSEQSKEQSKQQQQHTPTSVDSSTAEGDAAALAAAAALNSSTIPKDQTAARHACPNCERTWPKQFGPVCYECDTPQQRKANREQARREQNRRVLGFPIEDAVEASFDVLPEEAEEALPAAPAPPAPPAPPAAPPAPPVSKTTRRLRAAGYGAAWLNHQGLDQLIGNRDLKEVCHLMRAIGRRLPPEPEDFFEDYDRHLQEHKQAEADYLAPFPEPANNGLKTKDLRHTAERASGPGNKPKPANNGTSQGGLAPIGEALAHLPGVQSRMAA